MRFKINEKPNQEVIHCQTSFHLESYLKQKDRDCQVINFKLVSKENDYIAYFFEIKYFTEGTTKIIFFDSTGESGIVDTLDIASFEYIYPCQIIEIDENDFYITVDVKV